MQVSFTTKVSQDLQHIKRKQPQLFKKIQKQLRLFKENPRHRTLQNHKLKGNLQDAWSISIEDNFRMLYYWRNDEAVFFKIGSHDKVYKKT